MGEENQGNALSIDGDFTALWDKLIDIERFNRFFYEAANLILQDKDDDKIAYGAYVFSLQAKNFLMSLITFFFTEIWLREKRSIKMNGYGIHDPKFIS